MDVLALLHSKNRCLAKFLALSEDYLRRADAEATLEEGGDRPLGRVFNEELTGFQEEREETIRALEMYDRKIAELTDNFPLPDKTLELARAVKDALDQK